MDSPQKILFVCTGNICRSPLAHAVFNHHASRVGAAQRFETESAGTHGYHVGEDADRRMRDTAARRGVPFSHRARLFTDSDLAYYDLILLMGHNHLHHAQRMVKDPSQLEKLILYRYFDPKLEGSSEILEVPDPYYGGQSGFDQVFDIVDRTTGALLDHLLVDSL